METNNHNDEVKTDAQNHKKENNNLIAILAYIGPLVLIPFLMAKDNHFVKFHIKQGLVLLSISIILWALRRFMMPLWMILNIIDVGILILSIIGIVNVISKKEKELPLIGKFSKHFKI